MTRLLNAAVLLMALPFVPMAAAQDVATVERLFESGRFQEVTSALTPSAPPEVQFLAGQSFQKQNDGEGAARAYQALSALPESDAWHSVGRSAEQLLHGATDEALASAQTAVMVNGGLTEAHFQLGLVHARRSEWALAAQAFDQAAQINPAYAYAHYYGGLSHYRSGRPDRMATHFEQFLKTAPEAPERPEVMQLMRTVRGR